MGMGETFVCRSLREEDDGAVRKMIESTFPVFLGGKFWDWKYLHNPAFDRSLVAVAEDNGKIVGCNHWLLRAFRLSGSVVVDAVLGADIAVVPEYRKKGVGRAMMGFLRSKNADRKLPVTYIFADPELRKHFHAPVAGYVPAPGGTVLFTKILNWNKVKASATVFNERMMRGEFGDRLSKVDLTVAFMVQGAPTLCLRVNSGGVSVSEGHADVTVSSDVKTLSIVKDKGAGRWGLVGALLSGKLRFRGGLRKMFVLYRNLWVFREVFGGKIT